MGGRTVHHRGQTHTPRGKRSFSKKTKTNLMLIYFYNSASFIIFPLPRPLRSSPVFSPSSLSVRLRFVRTMSSHLPSLLLAGSYFVSLLSCGSDTGHWEQMHFRRNPSSSSCSFIPLLLLLVVLPLLLLLLILHCYFSHQHHVTMHESVTWVKSPQLLLTNVGIQRSSCIDREKICLRRHK